jgi:restriction system protein
MAFKLPQNSLYAVLLRSRWWASALAGLAAFALIRFILPAPYAAIGATPFFGIAAYVLYRQLRRPGARRVAQALERARALPAPRFLDALDAAFVRNGYQVERANGAADLELTQAGRVTLVACKRWKATRTGIEPIREFDAATADRGVKRIYVAAGEVTANARTFAEQRSIELMGEEELGRLLAG